MGRIAQQNESRTDYFLPDALGSVRQLTTQDGNVGLTQSFYPFGNPFNAMGPGASNYGYAGEWTDTTGLQFLRARYYAPSQGRFLTHDPFPGSLNQPATLNPYVYAVNNPVLYTDPSGENPLLMAALIGGIIGGGFNLGIQLYFLQPNSLYQVLHCLNWGEVAVALGAGVIAGLVGFTVFDATTAILGTGFWANVTAGSLSTILAGHYARFVGSILSGQNSQASVSNLGDIALDFIFGFVGGAVAYGLQRGSAGIAEDILQNLTNSANDRLAANPRYARNVLSPAEYAAGQTNVGLAPIQYGNAIEQVAADQVGDSWILGNLYEYRGGPYNPDFVGKGVFSGMNFDITTNTARSMINHLSRPYGPGLIIATYSRPTGFWLFP